MKLKWAMTAAAAGLALTVGAANAKIAPPSTGDGELILSVWDAEREMAYALDMGVRLNDFEPSDVDEPAFTMIWAADALLQQFLVASADNTVEWNVLVGDSTGTKAGQRRLALTLDPAVTEAQIELPGTTLALNGVLGLLNVYVGELNTLPTHNQDVNGDRKKNFLDNGSAVWAFGDGDFEGDMSFSGGSFSGELNESLNFWYLTNGSKTLSPVTATAYGIVAGGDFYHSTFTLQDDGTLVFAVPVPEAETWALLGLGLIGLGAYTRRRGAATESSEAQAAAWSSGLALA